jgi:hypothetical protein
MIAEDAVKSFTLRRIRACRGCKHGHAIRGQRATGSNQLAIHLDHARVAGLDGTQLRVIANLWNLNAAPVRNVNQTLPGLDRVRLAVHRD